MIWLDMPLWRIVVRVARRSALRILTREELWNGNREHLSSLFGSDSTVSWAVQSHRDHATRLPGQLAKLAEEGITTVRLRSPREVEDWWRALPPTVT